VKAGMKAAASSLSSSSSGPGVVGDGDSAEDDLVNATRRMQIR
jgi:hypothetical protein